MNVLKNLTLTAALAVTGAAAYAAAPAPDVLIPTHPGAQVVQGLSNNGKYGVSAIRPGDTGFSYSVGAVFYDLTGSEPVATNLMGEDSFAGAAFDVTDDGKIVVGTLNGKPGFWRDSNGAWEWVTLPYPTESLIIQQEDYYTGEIYEREYKFDGGHVKAVTPDGKYAVGIAECSAYEMIEKAVMWDLEKMEMVPVDSPVTNIWGQDDHQSRFLQLSDDGRYILAWNSFSYVGDEYLFVYDRETGKAISPFYSSVGGNRPVKRNPELDDIELDGYVSKSLTSNGRYVTGRVRPLGSSANYKGNSYTFLFDVFNEELEIFDDGVHDDTYGWSVTKDGLVLAATPADTPYADALIYYKNYMFPVETLLKDVYGVNLAYQGVENTGKPTLVSEDARTVVFVYEQEKSYLVRFHEPITDALDRINLMSGWVAYPSEGTKMTRMGTIELTFNNPIEGNADKFGEIALLDSKGAKIASPVSGGVTFNNMRMTVRFPETLLNDGENYRVVLPAGLCYVKGQPGSVNDAIEIGYVGRADVPVEVKSVSPAENTALPSLDLNDNPVVVTFDAAIRINGTIDNRPVARVYVDGGDEPLASLNLDVDTYTNTLVVYPSATLYLYKGSEYTIEVPEGAVTDLSGSGPSKAFDITYTGSYVPQLGDEIYLFRSDCSDYSPFLFFEGDHGEPTSEFEAMGFTRDETPWVVVRDDELSTDMAFASHSVYKDGRQANDWVATRQLKLPEDVESVLTFQSQSLRKSKTDMLKVYVYEQELNLNQLTQDDIDDILENADLIYSERQSPGASEDLMAGDWTDNVISLEKYKGKSIYICFLNDNRNQSMVMIDNIFVKKDVSSFITITDTPNVINQESVPVRGMLVVQSDLAEYDTLEMTLRDGNGNEVSGISESGLGLKSGDSYSFEFPEQLPLTVGEVNPYTIEYRLDDDANVYEGVVRNLAFASERRVVIEEYTGRECQFCPLGLAIMERLESLYGNRIVPVALHAYMGTDPKGANIQGYAASVFGGSTAAPMGRINRRLNLSAPMYQNDADGTYHMTKADVPGREENTWLDDVVEEFGEAAYLDLNVVPKAAESGYLAYDITVKSALNLKDQNVRVLGILLEDGLNDRQKNGIFNISDPLLGEFGEGGIYGSATFNYTFNNVARGVWGQSHNGTPRLIPAELEAGKEYAVEMTYEVPSIVSNLENTKMAVLLIDENTGKVLNANLSTNTPSGVEEIMGETAESIRIFRTGADITVAGPDETAVEIYTLDGRKLKSAYGTGTVTVSLDGYRGIVIVRAAGARTAVTKKIMM